MSSISISPTRSDDTELGTFTVVGKRMDEDGIVKWTIKWDWDDEEEECEDVQLESVEGLEEIEAFEAGQNYSPADLQTIVPEVAQQSVFAACSTISELVAVVLEHEQTSGLKGFRFLSFEAARSTLFEAFASMDSRLLAELKSGNLQRRKYLDRNFRLMLYSLYSEQLTDEQGRRPAHYMFEFTDEYGLAPTKAEANALLAHARQYMTDPQFAYDTDLESDADTFMYKHLYPSGYTRVTEGKQHRADIVLEFIRVSQDYLDRWGLARMLQAWRELGYTHNTDGRIRAHSKEASSNYLMILMASISKKSFRGKWSNRGQLIFNCITQSDAAAMEVALTVISGAELSSGHGMSHHPAGGSVASNWAPRYIWIWKAWESEALDTVEMNVATEMDVLARQESDREAKREYVELHEAIERRDILAAKVKLHEIEVEMARIHVEVRKEVPPSLLEMFFEDEEIPDSQETAD